MCEILFHSVPEGPNGPWKAVAQCQTHGLTLEDNDAPLCPIGRIEKAVAEGLAKTEANARLIAAAPDMLTLLKLALGDTEYVLSPGFWNEVRAAVAKAEGAPRAKEEEK